MTQKQKNALKKKTKNILFLKYFQCFDILIGMSAIQHFNFNESDPFWQFVI